MFVRAIWRALVRALASAPIRALLQTLVTAPLSAPLRALVQARLTALVRAPQTGLLPAPLCSPLMTLLPSPQRALTPVSPLIILQVTVRTMVWAAHLPLAKESQAALIVGLAAAGVPRVTLPDAALVPAQEELTPSAH